MERIDSGSIDMILTDLPYGITKCKWDSCIPLERLWEQYERVIKKNGAILLFSSQPFTTELIASNKKLFRYEIIWEKTMKSGFLNAKKMPLRGHENICVFYKHLPTFNPQMEKVNANGIGRTRFNSRGKLTEQYNEFRNPEWEYTESGFRYPSDVVKFSNWNGSLFGKKTDKSVKHPTQKPVDLLEYLIKTYSNAGDIVLDSCAGSGSTAIAAINTKRKFICFEKDEKIYKTCRERVINTNAQISFV